MIFSPGIERALRVALLAHEGQVRKNLERVPYATHPCHVALILARLGHDDVVLQAALLHDVVEDCPGWTFERVEAEFGRDVRSIVAELTEDKGLPWEQRKRAAVEGAARLSPGALAIKAVDKLHNLQSLLDDLERTDDHAGVWARFTGGRDRTLAVAADLVDELGPRVDPRLAEPLRATLARLVAIAAGRRP